MALKARGSLNYGTPCIYTACKESQWGRMSFVQTKLVDQIVYPALIWECPYRWFMTLPSQKCCFLKFSLLFEPHTCTVNHIRKESNRKRSFSLNITSRVHCLYNDRKVEMKLEYILQTLKEIQIRVTNLYNIIQMPCFLFTSYQIMKPPLNLPLKMAEWRKLRLMHLYRSVDVRAAFHQSN